MIICLAGFSGSGKSTLLENWQSAAESDWDFKDLDTLSLERLKSVGGCRYESLGEAIKAQGMEIFRREEALALDATLLENQTKNFCLSLGGGTLGRGLERIKRADNTYLVGLDVSFKTCWGRIQNDSNRPLTALGEQAMLEKFTRRRSLLLKADLILDENELKSPPSLQALVQKLRGY